jgi:hypothetical protein
LIKGSIGDLEAEAEDVTRILGYKTAVI